MSYCPGCASLEREMDRLKTEYELRASGAAGRANERESALRADLERERAAAALVLETSAREVARLEKERDAAYEIRDAGWVQTEGVIRERDALKAALVECLIQSPHSVDAPEGCLCRWCKARRLLGMEGPDRKREDWVRHLRKHPEEKAPELSCGYCRDEIRAALATPAEPPVKAPVVSLPGEGGTPPRVEGQSRFGPMPIKTPKGDR